MKPLVRKLLPLGVLALSIGTGIVLISTGPQAERRTPAPLVPTVDVVELQPREYQVIVDSRGTVAPRTQSTLIPEVAGRIVEVAPDFRNGGFFEADQELVRIDPRDYEHALTVARAELAQQRLNLREVEAQAEQARNDWEKLGIGGEPNDLVLYKPQLDSARAAVAAAEAQVLQAETALERTRVRAPYAGRILEKQVDVGQYVAPGTILATLYAVDYVEVRLPLTDQQLAFVELPEAYRDDPNTRKPGPPVTLTTRVGGTIHEWQGRIIRTEGAIDTQSRQLFVVAQVDDPYQRRDDGRPPLKIGQFVEARIEGRTLSGVYVLPRRAVRNGNEIVIVTPDERIERRRIDVLWSDESSIVTADGIAAGERVSLTPVPFAADGAPVRVNAPADAGPAARES